MADPSWVRKLNRARVNVRQPLADLANFLSGTREDGSHFEARGLHANTSRDLSRLFGKALPPEQAIATADALGYANEILPGALQAAAGNEFFGPSGFDWQDMYENWEGQERARQDMQPQPPAPAEPGGPDVFRLGARTAEGAAGLIDRGVEALKLKPLAEALAGTVKPAQQGADERAAMARSMVSRLPW